MTTFNELQKSAIGLSMSTAWNAADYDHVQIPLDSDLTIGWESLSHAKRMHLRGVANHLVRYLIEDGVIALVDDGQREYEAVGNVSDYEKGDWARVTDDDGVYEFLVTDVSPWSVEGASISRRVRPGRRFERVPKPAAVPDPKAHPIIIDNLTGKVYQAQHRILGALYYTFGDTIGESPHYFQDWTAMELADAEGEG